VGIIGQHSISGLPSKENTGARGCGSAVQVSPWLALMYALRGL